MNIYQKKTRRTKVNYRKIYKSHYGDIPVDKDGRTYEIHHIDGDDTNNEPSNLVALSIQDHYDIHYSQGDYDACFSIGVRMKMDPQQLSKLSSDAQTRRVLNGTHHLLKTGEDHPSYRHDMLTFENIKSGEVINTTMYDFQRMYNLNGSHLSLLVNGHCRTIKGWSIMNQMDDGSFARSSDWHNTRDSKKYLFKNRKTGELIHTTQYDLYTNHGASRRGVNSIVRGDSKFTGNWEIAPQ